VLASAKQRHQHGAGSGGICKKAAWRRHRGGERNQWREAAWQRMLKKSWRKLGNKSRLISKWRPAS
jgi:hypothetical protein